MQPVTLAHEHTVIRVQVVYNVITDKSQVTYRCMSPLGCAWAHIIQTDGDVLMSQPSLQTLKQAEARLFKKESDVQPVT